MFIITHALGYNVSQRSSSVGLDYYSMLNKLVWDTFTYTNNRPVSMQNCMNEKQMV